jgi:hypothetical protein
MQPDHQCSAPAQSGQHFSTIISAALQHNHRCSTSAQSPVQRFSTIISAALQHNHQCSASAQSSGQHFSTIISAAEFNTAELHVLKHFKYSRIQNKQIQYGPIVPECTVAPLSERQMTRITVLAV